MEKFYESDFINVLVDPENNFVKTIRKPATNNYTRALYKNDILEWKKVIQNHYIIRQLVDERDFIFTIDPDMQIWLNQTLIAPAVQAGLKKVAFIVSDDIFAQISLEQAMNEKESVPLEIQYFDNEQEANTWLFE